MSHFPSSRSLGSLDFLQPLLTTPRVVGSVINSGWVTVSLFLSFLSQNSTAESLVLCIPTTIICDCEVERTIIKGWMQNKCGKFMQISIRNPVVLGDAGVFVLFT